jgi:hypothetical protein
MRTNYQSLTTFNLTEGHFKSNEDFGQIAITKYWSLSEERYYRQP